MRASQRRIRTAAMRQKERRVVQRRYGTDKQPYSAEEYYSFQCYEDVSEVRGTVGTAAVPVNLMPAGFLTKVIWITCPDTSPGNLFTRISPGGSEASAVNTGGCIMLRPGESKGPFFVGRSSLSVIGSIAATEFEITFGW